MDVTREEYDPTNDPDHRVPPDTPEVREPISAPLLPRPIRAEEMVVEPGHPVPVPVTGRLEDRPHFIRNVDGVELCGQDGLPWPCPTILEQEAQVTAAAFPQPHELVTLEEAASAAGVSSDELRARIGAQGRRYG